MMRAAQRTARWLRWMEDGILAALVLTLVGLAGAQILLRDLFNSGIAWADPVMRDLVLWTGMLGALAAVRDDKHIALDVLQRFLSALVQKIARAVTLLFTAAVCGAMAWYCFVMLQNDIGSGSSGPLPAWVPETILPLAFALMGLRFVLRAFAPPAHVPVLLHDPAAAQAEVHSA
jgi:TRAP-type C4-dicarboxylate transport system permease small subunit